MKKNVLLLFGGGSSEHDISIVSADFVASQIDSKAFNLIKVEVDKNFKWFIDKNEVSLNKDKELVLSNNEKLKVDLCIPCFHGYPGETGDIQSHLNLLDIPYFGCDSQGSRICFNKVLTKLYLEMIGIPTTPFIALSSSSDLSEAHSFFKNHKDVFVKAANQGSSIGCYHVKDEKELEESINKAFEYSDFVLIEKTIMARELEIATYEFNKEIHATSPGEIICPNKFYTYEEKYNGQSKTQIVAKTQVPEKVEEKLKEYSKKAFKALNLRHLSRMDFFYSDTEEIFLNEINTFPGMTSVSLFPKMLEENGDNFTQFLNQNLKSLL